MKKIVAFFCALFMSVALKAQTDVYNKAVLQLQNNYNEGKYAEVFNSFSTEMQAALPLENTKQFLSGLKSDAGIIKSFSFQRFEHTTVGVYKTEFENGVFSLNISLDKANKINGLFLKPFEEENNANVTNGLTEYPKEISAIIFEKAKDFPNNTQLSIAVVQNGKKNYYGIIKQNDEIKPIENQDKVFEIGSITKVFTSSVFVSLVEDKSIKIDDFINPYYTFPFKNKTQIRFSDLANHTSGLPRLPKNLNLSNEENPYKNYGSKELNTYLKDLLKLESKPAEKYSYSNLGAGILGYTLGLSQKTTFPELLQKRIFDKYGMNNSYTSSANLGSKLVKGLNVNGEEVPNWDFDVLFGGGGILSSTSDLVKFAKAQFDLNNKELALTRKPTFTINEKVRIGLGWHILKSEKGTDLFWHNGGTGGYSSSMSVDVENKTAVVILSNLSAFSSKNGNIDKICLELINEISK